MNQQNSNTLEQPDSNQLNRPIFWSIPESTLSIQELERKSATLKERLSTITKNHTCVRFATSLAAEDMVITDAIVSAKLNIEFFTIATGRLHQETVDMTREVEDHYNINIARMYPDEQGIQAFVEEYGMNGFYDGETAKKACCGVRKIRPLNNALIGADAWLTGQRREQATTRTALNFEELDETRGIAKFNPLYDWSESDIWAYTLHRSVLIHPLYFKGYPSIGCEPCTRPVKKYEDIRAGRWWWLQSESKECGLHVNE